MLFSDESESSTGPLLLQRQAERSPAAIPWDELRASRRSRFIEESITLRIIENAQRANYNNKTTLHLEDSLQLAAGIFNKWKKQLEFR